MTAADETIFALSSGALPSAIAIVRISGPDARSVARILDFAMPLPRQAAVRTLRGSDGDILDRGIVLFFPGAESATGEDVVELHVHGGRASVRALLRRLAEDSAMRHAEAGEFTRRAMLNGRIGLIEAEALGDLLAADTEMQRRRAIAMPTRLTTAIDELRGAIMELSARVEAAIDHDGPDVAEAEIGEIATAVAAQIDATLAGPSATRLREGFRVVIAGPPNAGKSSLLNALVARDAAIVSDVSGTTRDVIDVGIVIGGLPVRMIDTAGLRMTDDRVEAIGVARAGAEIESADVVIWLGVDAPPSTMAAIIVVDAKADLRPQRPSPRNLSVSAHTGEGLSALGDRIVDHLRSILPPEGEALWNDRQREVLGEISVHLAACAEQSDVVLAADELRRIRDLVDRLTGKADVAHLLDAIFASFCLGK